MIFPGLPCPGISFAKNEGIVNIEVQFNVGTKQFAMVMSGQGLCSKKYKVSGNVALAGVTLKLQGPTL